MIACDRCNAKVEAEWRFEGRREHRRDDLFEPPRWMLFTLCEGCRAALYEWINPEGIE